MVLSNFVNNFLESSILFNGFLDYCGCVDSLYHFLLDSCYLFLWNLNGFLSYNSHFICSPVNKGYDYGILLWVLEWFGYNCGLNFIIWCFCNSWKNNSIFRDCPLFEELCDNTLNLLWLFDYFRVICYLSFKSWDCIYCVFGLARLLNRSWLGSDRFIINYIKLSFSVLSDNKSFSTFSSLCLNFIIFSKWILCYNNINYFLSCDIRNFRIVINFFNDILNCRWVVLLLVNGRFWSNKWCD